jgi:hypothetical protein
MESTHNIRFLEDASTFLSCCFESIPFKLIKGLQLGANPRRRITYLEIDCGVYREAIVYMVGLGMVVILSYIRGRVTLINFVLSSLPLDFFSFFKAYV